MSMIEKLVEKMPKGALLGLMEKGIREGEKALEEYLLRNQEEKSIKVAINIQLNNENKLMVTLYDKEKNAVLHQSDTLAPYLLGQEAGGENAGQ